MKNEAEGKPAIKSPGRVFQRKGSSYWWIGYSLDGQEFRESTHTADLRQAEKFLKHRLRQVGAAQLRVAEFITPRMEKVRVSELLDGLADDYQLRGKDSPQFRSNLKYVREAFGHWRALALTAEKVDEYIKERLEANSQPATINRRLQLLKQAYKKAIERKHLSKVPLIRHLSEEGNTRQGFFSEADFREVLQGLPEYLQDFCLFGYLVGWRKNECATLDWEDVDGDTIRLKGINSKNGKPRMTVLTGELVELMERRKAARAIKKASGDIRLSALVFHREGQPIGDIRKAWQTACVAAGVGKFVCRQCEQPANGHKCEVCGGDVRYVGRIFHDLRRTAVRNMVRAGVRETAAMSISGHRTRSIFDRYNIVSEDDLRDAMEKTQAHLKGARKQEQPTVITKSAAKK
ncbi:MAG: site-specific integrase [Candidatus Korobacteraceae bacterium]|jgi:integrase